MKLTYKIYTNIGDREINEDSVGEVKTENGHCFVLADGLGGHGGGEQASGMAVQSVLSIFADCYDETFLDKCFEAAQTKITQEQEKNSKLQDMKTTMVVLVLKDGKARWGHIGDSRLYLFKKNKIECRTLDHSVPQMLVNTGEIKEKDIRGHEDRNRLLRVIGSPWGNRSYELSAPVSIKKKQAILMCSDGFWELIEEKEMQTLLKKSKTVEEWLDQMVYRVKKNGLNTDMDNNSAIAIWMEESRDAK